MIKFHPSSQSVYQSRKASRPYDRWVQTISPPEATQTGPTSHIFFVSLDVSSFDPHPFFLTHLSLPRPPTRVDPTREILQIKPPRAPRTHPPTTMAEVADASRRATLGASTSPPPSAPSAAGSGDRKRGRSSPVLPPPPPGPPPTGAQNKRQRAEGGGFDRRRLGGGGGGGQDDRR